MMALITANKNHRYKIKEKDVDFPHVYLRYVNSNPDDPDHPFIREEIKVVRWVDLDKLFAGDLNDHRRRRKIVGVERWEIIHLPDRETVKRLDPDKARDEERKARGKRLMSRKHKRGHRRQGKMVNR